MHEGPGSFCCYLLLTCLVCCCSACMLHHALTSRTESYTWSRNAPSRYCAAVKMGTRHQLRLATQLLLSGARHGPQAFRARVPNVYGTSPRSERGFSSTALCCGA